jgi:hypothetical protein
MRALDTKRLCLSILGIVLAGWIAAAQGGRPDKVDDRALRNAGKTGDEWITHGLNYAEQRFSPLTGWAWRGRMSSEPGADNSRQLLLSSTA